MQKRQKKLKLNYIKCSKNMVWDWPYQNAYSYKAKCCSNCSPSYPLTLKHYDFLKKEIKNLLDTGIIHKNMSPWASPIIIVKNYMPEGVPQQFCFCIDYRKLNSLLPTVTPAMAQREVLSHLFLCPKLMNSLHY